MILLILAVLWAVVLGPSLFKRFSERRSTESIDSFHHSLHLLERTGPKLIQPAYRLEAHQNGGQIGSPVAGTGRPNLVLLKPLDGGAGTAALDEVVDEASGERFERLGAPSELLEAEASRPSLAQRAEEYRRERNRRRRRDIVLGLAVTTLLTALLGIVHGLRMLWVLTVLSTVALVAYAALFHYARLLAGAGRSSARRPLPSARRRPHRAAGPTGWEDDGYGYGGPSVAWDIRQAAAAGFPGAWDELEEGEGAYGNVVAMVSDEEAWYGAADASFDDDSTGASYRRRAAGAR